MLHLDIQRPGVRGVEDALDALTAGERLSDYRVKPGAPPAEAEKLTRLHRLPQVLLLHLGRFAYDAERGVPVKLHQHVAFPALLRLRPQWLSDDCAERRGGGGSGGGAAYRLVAVVTHHGRNSTSERAAAFLCFFCLPVCLCVLLVLLLAALSPSTCARLHTRVARVPARLMAVLQPGPWRAG